MSTRQESVAAIKNGVIESGILSRVLEKYHQSIKNAPTNSQKFDVLSNLPEETLQKMSQEKAAEIQRTKTAMSTFSAISGSSLLFAGVVKAAMGATVFGAVAGALPVVAATSLALSAGAMVMVPLALYIQKRKNENAFEVVEENAKQNPEQQQISLNDKKEMVIKALKEEWEQALEIKRKWLEDFLKVEQVKQTVSNAVDAVSRATMIHDIRARSQEIMQERFLSNQEKARMWTTDYDSRASSYAQHFEAEKKKAEMRTTRASKVLVGGSVTAGVGMAAMLSTPITLFSATPAFLSPIITSLSGAAWFAAIPAALPLAPIAGALVGGGLVLAAIAALKNTIEADQDIKVKINNKMQEDLKNAEIKPEGYDLTAKEKITVLFESGIKTIGDAIKSNAQKLKAVASQAISDRAPRIALPPAIPMVMKRLAEFRAAVTGIFDPESRNGVKVNTTTKPAP